MYETLIRPHEVAHVAAPLPIDAVREKLQVAEVQKEERRLKQIAASRAKRDDAAGTTQGSPSAKQSGNKRKRDETNNEAVEEGGEDSQSDAKRAKTQSQYVGETDNDFVEPLSSGADLQSKAKETEAPAMSPSLLTVSQPIKEVRGHTSYLTFACLLPSIFIAPKIARTPSPEIKAIPEPAQPSPEPEESPPSNEDQGGSHPSMNVDREEQSMREDHVIKPSQDLDKPSVRTTMNTVSPQ
jgi:tRNA (adenine57-N1/adenine58-N1)-methyltransferase catalytic subunit